MAAETSPFGTTQFRMTAKDVVRTDFSQARRGLDPDEVNAHLGRVADHVAEMEARLHDLEARLREREQAVAPDEAARNEAYETTAARIADLVRTFDQAMERMRVDAETELETRLAEARANAERIDEEAEKTRREAETEAARIVREAQVRAQTASVDAERAAQEAIAALESRRRMLLENIHRIREGLGHTVESVDAVLHVADGVRVVLDEPGHMPASG